MGKIIFLILIFWSFLANGQELGDSDFDDCLWFGDIVIPSQEFLDSEEFRAPFEPVTFDTLNIDELINFRREIVRSGEADEVSVDFLISKSRKNSELVGIYWPSGKIITLPDKAVPGTLKLEIKDKRIILSWFQKDYKDGSYWLYFSELRQDLGVKEDKYVSIVPVLREKSYKQKYVPTQAW